MEVSDKLLTGIRSYILLRKNGSMILRGHFGYEWQTNQLEARCGRVIHFGNDEIEKNQIKTAIKHLSSKEESCRCGIYGVTDGGMKYGLDHRCKCTVVGWGITSFNEYGWRAQFARIEKIWLGNHICDYCKINIISHISFLSKDGTVHYFLCDDCVRKEIIRGAKKRINYRFVPILEVMEELGNRYSVPVDWGSPL